MMITVFVGCAATDSILKSDLEDDGMSHYAPKKSSGSVGLEVQELIKGGYFKKAEELAEGSGISQEHFMLMAKCVSVNLFEEFLFNASKEVEQESLLIAATAVATEFNLPVYEARTEGYARAINCMETGEVEKIRQYIDHQDIANSFEYSLNSYMQAPERIRERAAWIKSQDMLSCGGVTAAVVRFLKKTLRQYEEYSRPENLHWDLHKLQARNVVACFNYFPQAEEALYDLVEQGRKEHVRQLLVSAREVAAEFSSVDTVKK